MNILHRYIAKTIVQASAMVIFAVIGLSFFIGMLGELKFIGTGDYNFLQALLYVLLKLPHDLYQFFPMLVLLGGVLGLGILSTHHELIVMRTSGVSVQRVVGAVLIAALILIAFATLLGESLAPKMVYMAERQKASLQNGGQAIATASGVWIHEGNNFLHVDRVVGRKHLEGVKRYEFDPYHRLLAAYYAKSLDLQNDHWILHDLVKTTFKKNQTSSEHFEIAVWDLALNPNLVNVGMVLPEELSLPSLVSHSKNLIKNGMQANRFQFEFWKRVFQPMTTLVMILIAIPFVFGAPRSSTSWRILFGIILGFVFYILNALFGQFSVVFQVPAWLAALIPPVFFAMVGYYFMLKAK